MLGSSSFPALSPCVTQKSEEVEGLGVGDRMWHPPVGGLCLVASEHHSLGPNSWRCFTVPAHLTIHGNGAGRCASRVIHSFTHPPTHRPGTPKPFPSHLKLFLSLPLVREPGVSLFNTSWFHSLFKQLAPAECGILEKIALNSDASSLRKIGCSSSWHLIVKLEKYFY